ESHREYRLRAPCRDRERSACRQVSSRLGPQGGPTARAGGRRKAAADLSDSGFARSARRGGAQRCRVAKRGSDLSGVRPQAQERVRCDVGASRSSRPRPACERRRDLQRRMDNASGIATLLETAAALHEAGAKLRRSVLFVAVTGEEKGLLGSQYFATHPTVN